MEIRTRLNLPDETTEIQYVEMVCHRCGSPVRIALPPDIMDYKSAYEELEKTVHELWHENQKLKHENDLLLKILE